MKQRADTSTESSMISPEEQAFIDLVNREAQRIHLLNESNRPVPATPRTKELIVWQPTFEMGDFGLPPSRSSEANNPKECPEPLNRGAEGLEAEEKRLKNGLKRIREDSIGTDSLVPKEKKKTKNSSNGVVLYDLNKEDESLYGASKLSLWYKS